MKKNEILEMIQKIFDGLHQGGIIETQITVKEDVVLIGDGSALDSIAFVTFFMELEEKLADTLEEEIYISLDDIADLESSKGIDVRVIVEYIEKLTR